MGAAVCRRAASVVAALAVVLIFVPVMPVAAQSVAADTPREILKDFIRDIVPLYVPLPDVPPSPMPARPTSASASSAMGATETGATGAGVASGDVPPRNDAQGREIVLDLGQFSSPADAEAHWETLRRRHTDILNGLERVNIAAAPARLAVGVLTDPGLARMACAGLLAEQDPCRPYWVAPATEAAMDAHAAGR